MDGTVGRRPPQRGPADPLGPKAKEEPREQTLADATLEAVSAGVDMIAGRYKLQEILGRGGVGVVYRARDLDLGEEIAIKVLQGQATRNTQDLERFKREIITARKITHANVIRIHDFGMSGEEAFISMELLSGGTLADRIEDGPLGWKQGLEIAIGICEGLDAAHQMGIIHRDIKPDNVLFDAAGRPKLVDFGLARLASAPTRTIGFSGTPFYVSPEQAEGGEVTGRSDIYSLGVLLFEMFTGRLPFLADNLVRLAVMHANEPPPAPRSIRADMPATLEALILKCLSKDAASRYASASDVALDLRAVRDGKAPPGIGPYARDQATVIRTPAATPSGERNIATDKTLAGVASPPPAPVGALRPERSGDRPSGPSRSAARPAPTPAPRPDGRPSQRPMPSPAASEMPTTQPPKRRESKVPLVLAIGGGVALIALVSVLASKFGGETGAVATPIAVRSPTATVEEIQIPTEPATATPVETPAVAAKTATPAPVQTRIAMATPKATPKPVSTPVAVTTAVMALATPAPTPASTPAGKGTIKILSAKTAAGGRREVLVYVGSRESGAPGSLQLPAGTYTVRFVDKKTKALIKDAQLTLKGGETIKVELSAVGGDNIIIGRVAS